MTSVAIPIQNTPILELQQGPFAPVAPHLNETTLPNTIKRTSDDKFDISTSAFLTPVKKNISPGIPKKKLLTKVIVSSIRQARATPVETILMLPFNPHTSNGIGALVGDGIETAVMVGELGKHAYNQMTWDNTKKAGAAVGNYFLTHDPFEAANDVLICTHKAAIETCNLGYEIIASMITGVASNTNVLIDESNGKDNGLSYTYKINQKQDGTFNNAVMVPLHWHMEEATGFEKDYKALKIKSIDPNANLSGAEEVDAAIGKGRNQKLLTTFYVDSNGHVVKQETNTPTGKITHYYDQNNPLCYFVTPTAKEYLPASAKMNRMFAEFGIPSDKDIQKAQCGYRTKTENTTSALTGIQINSMDDDYVYVTTTNIKSSETEFYPKATNGYNEKGRHEGVKFQEDIERFTKYSREEFSYHEYYRIPRNIFDKHNFANTSGESTSYTIPPKHFKKFIDLKKLGLIKKQDDIIAGVGRYLKHDKKRYTKADLKNFQASRELASKTIYQKRGNQYIPCSNEEVQAQIIELRKTIRDPANQPLKIYDGKTDLVEISSEKALEQIGKTTICNNSGKCLYRKSDFPFYTEGENGYTQLTLGKADALSKMPSFNEREWECIDKVISDKSIPDSEELEILVISGSYATQSELHPYQKTCIIPVSELRNNGFSLENEDAISSYNIYDILDKCNYQHIVTTGYDEIKDNENIPDEVKAQLKPITTAQTKTIIGEREYQAGLAPVTFTRNSDNTPQNMALGNNHLVHEQTRTCVKDIDYTRGIITLADRRTGQPIQMLTYPSNIDLTQANMTSDDMTNCSCRDIFIRNNSSNSESQMIWLRDNPKTGEVYLVDENTGQIMRGPMKVEHQKIFHQIKDANGVTQKRHFGTKIFVTGQDSQGKNFTVDFSPYYELTKDGTLSAKKQSQYMYQYFSGLDEGNIFSDYDKHLNDPSRVVNKVGNFTIIQGEHNDRLGYTEYAFYNKNKGQAIIRIDSQTGGCNICLGKYNFYDAPQEDEFNEGESWIKNPNDPRFARIMGILANMTYDSAKESGNLNQEHCLSSQNKTLPLGQQYWNIVLNNRATVDIQETLNNLPIKTPEAPSNTSTPNDLIDHLSTNSVPVDTTTSPQIDGNTR